MIRMLALSAAAVLGLASAAQAQTAPDYVMMAGASDKFEITEAKLALAHAHDPKLKEFARMMVHDHTESTKKVKAAATSIMGHKPPPPQLTSKQASMVETLKSTRGADFDRTYVQQQRQAHQQALELQQGYANNGDAPALRQVASEIVPVVQQHIDMLKQMGG